MKLIPLLLLIHLSVSAQEVTDSIILEKMDSLVVYKHAYHDTLNCRGYKDTANLNRQAAVLYYLIQVVNGIRKGCNDEDSDRVIEMQEWLIRQRNEIRWAREMDYNES